MKAMSKCMTCHRFHELRSLRNAVKRFEDGSETATLITAHEADQRRIEKLMADNTRISVELLEVKHENRALKEEVSRIQSDYDLLVQKYTSLRNETVYESVINSAEFQDRIDQLVLSLFNELEDKQAYIVKLEAQIHKDYTNSSKPSSQCPNHKKIVNNREKTGASVGGYWQTNYYDETLQTIAGKLDLQLNTRYRTREQLRRFLKY